MTKHAVKEHPATERRRFERVDIAHDSQVLVLEPKGKKVGVLRQIGRGGFMMEPEKNFSKDDKAHKLTIHEPDEKLRIEVKARVLYSDPRFVGFEFVDLDADAAVEVGIIIGKYYEAER
jgi:hypothetical protein